MSLNDPKWGNRGGGDNRGGDGNQGPPDLEELWRDFNRRLSGMFGRGGGSGGGDGGNKMPDLNFRQFGGGIGLIAAFAAVIWLASGFYIVDASQRGIVLQFGRFVEATEQEGAGIDAGRRTSRGCAGACLIRSRRMNW